MTVTIQEIGYSFLQTYFHRMNKDPSKVSALYSNTAEITHINYQVNFSHEDDILPTIKIIGKDNISSFFTRNNKKVCDLRAKIDSIDYQNTGSKHESILLLITGEMFWTNTPSYRFCQTIVLTPINSNSSCYEVTNDVMRFLPDIDSLYIPEVKAKEQLPEKDEEIKESVVNNVQSTIDEKTPSEMAIKEQKESKQQSEEKKSEKEKEDTPISNTKDNIETSKPEVNHPVETEQQAVSENTIEDLHKQEKDIKQSSHESIDEERPKVDNSETENSNKEPTVTTTPLSPPAQAPKLSWASTVSKGAPSGKGRSEFTKIEQTTTTTVPAPKSKLNNNSERKFDMSSRKDNGSNRNNKKRQTFSTVNKDGFYPIYIRGTSGVNENDLRKKLDIDFGTVVKMTNSDNFVVVDFENQQSQISALEKKTFKIGDIEMSLERKTQGKKPYFNNSNGGPNANNAGMNSPNQQRPHKKYNLKKKD